MLAVAMIVMTAGVVFWKIARPDKDAWNYSAATAIADFYHDTGNLPNSHEALLKYLQKGEGKSMLDKGFVSAVQRMNFRGVDSRAFLSGSDFVGLPDEPDQEGPLNQFIRKLCMADPAN